MGVALIAALALGFSRLAVPSLWHDELVHVFVAQHILDTGWPALPSGIVYPQSGLYNYLLAVFMCCFGNGEIAVRSLSVIAAVPTLLLFYLLGRQTIGRNLAVVALFALALSPWHVAWTREARFYELQCLGYGLFLLGAWTFLEHRNAPMRHTGAALALLGYLIGIFSSFHAILFLGPVFAYAMFRGILYPADRTRAFAFAGALTMLGFLTLAVLYLNPNEADQAATLGTGIGGELTDPKRMVRNYYLIWLQQNHSSGYLLLAALGTLYLPVRFGRRGVFIALAFWIPLLVLTFGIGYRRPRFIYFAFPVYLALVAGGMGLLAHGLFAWRKSRWMIPVTALSAILILRLAMSFIGLTADSIETASGSHETLARRHPEWRGPCTWVAKNLQSDDAVLTTTYLPVLYYTGRVDDWFPNRFLPWEKDESGLEGIGSLEGLQQFMRAHPSGYFLAESWRFAYWRRHGDVGADLGMEVEWVQMNMTVLAHASSRNVTVYAWGNAAARAKDAKP